MSTKREIALDTETTGLDPREGHRIIEIGCVELRNHIPTGREYHAYINPQRDITEEASFVSGLTEEFLSSYPTFDKIVDDFLDFIGTESTLVIHNAAFDMGFINAELARLGRDEIPFERSFDTVKLARKKYPGSPANLDALCRRFDIDLSSREKHGALVDAKLLAHVYLELLGGRQKSFLLSDKKEETEIAQQPVVFKRRTFSLSLEELQEHQAFIQKNIPNALWKF